MIADLAMQRALDRYHQAGIPGLTEKEKTLATLWYFDAKVANGGFAHFFRSKEGELAAFAPAAFRQVGAEAFATIAERANAVFGLHGVPADKTKRTIALDALSAADRRVFDKLEIEYADSDTDVDGYIEGYLTGKPDANR